jgi:hypothetical protein
VLLNKGVSLYHPLLRVQGHFIFCFMPRTPNLPASRSRSNFPNGWKFSRCASRLYSCTSSPELMIPLSLTARFLYLKWPAILIRQLFCGGTLLLEIGGYVLRASVEWHANGAATIWLQRMQSSGMDANGMDLLIPCIKCDARRRSDRTVITSPFSPRRL